MGVDFDRGLTLRRLMIGITAQVFALLGAPDEARADCASGDGNITTAVTCTVPQVLTGSTGTIVSGATLTTNPTAYTISSSGGTLINNGSITSTGGNITVQSNFSANITNTGDIEGGLVQRGGSAIETVTIVLYGNSTITSSGTIGGSIVINGDGVVNVTGGKILGDIFSGLGSVSGSMTTGTLNFNLGTGSFTPNGNLQIAAINVESGTLIIPETVNNQFGIPVVSNFLGSTNSLTINGTLQLNTLQLQNLSGVFVQKPAGTLVMEITPTASSQLKISSLSNLTGGTATLAGTLALAYQPGTYQPRTYTLISADRSVTGTFSNITGTVPTPGLTQAITVDPTDVDLTLSGVVTPTNATIFPAMATSVVLTGQQMTGILLDRLGARQADITDGTATAGAASGTPLQLAQSGNIAALGDIASVLPQALASEGAWFRGIGDFASVSGNAAAPGFTGASGGFLAGFDRPIATDLYLGLAAGYIHSDLSQSTAASGQIDSGRVAVYGGGWLGPNLLTGTVGYAYDWISTARTLSSVGTAAQAHNGNEFSIGGQWSLPTPVTGIAGTALVTPKIGVQFLHLAEDGFTETGAGSFDLSSRGNDTDSAQPYLSLAASERFVADDGTEITPEIRLGYNREVLSNNRVINVTATDGTAFLIQGVKPSRDMLSAGIGATLRAQDNILLYANYDAILPTGNTINHTVSAGLRVRF
jgi:fibronectin-binding autotransporter adhesin